jgi:hypothetical protein
LYFVFIQKQAPKLSTIIQDQASNTILHSDHILKVGTTKASVKTSTATATDLLPKLWAEGESIWTCSLNQTRSLGIFHDPHPVSQSYWGAIVQARTSESSDK